MNIQDEMVRLTDMMKADKVTQILNSCSDPDDIYTQDVEEACERVAKAMTKHGEVAELVRAIFDEDPGLQDMLAGIKSKVERAIDAVAEERTND